MYILKNAVKSITRNKLRNILIGIIVLIISVSACVSLSIRQAAETAKADTLSSLNVTAQISFDRQKAMEEMQKNESSDNQDSQNNQSSDSNQKSFDRGKFDFGVLQGTSLSLDDYMKYTKALSSGDGYYYSGAVSLNATGDLIPYGTDETDSSTSSDSSKSSDKKSDSTQNNSDSSSQEKNAPPEMGGFGGMGGDSDGGMRGRLSRGDFSITGFSSYDAMLSLFGDDGSCKISDGKMFDESSDALECIISNELASYNNLKVGDTVTLANPSCEDETYKLKIVGIYKNSEASSTENNRFMMNDPANNIYMNYTAFSKIISASEKADNKTTDSSGNEKSAVLKDNLAFTYTFKNVDNYNTFSKKVYDLGLSDDYKVSSSDLTAYENSLRPLETLSTTAMWFFFIVLAVGGAILITLNVFSLRERKYEVGALTAIGMKKAKVAAQFVTEILIVTFAALIIGTSVGAVVSVPVTNTLLSSQIESEQSSSDKISQNFGFKNDGNSAPSMGTPPMGGHGMRSSEKSASVKYVDSVSSATNLMVILKLALVGLFLTLIASLAALICIMRYEPLKILSNRS